MHILYGTMVALTFKLNLPLFLIFTNLPDLDALLDVLTDNIKYHTYLFHNILSSIFLLIIGSIFFSFKLVFIALFLHYLLDIAYKREWLYPFSKKKFGFVTFKKKYPFWVYLFYDGNIYFTIISLIIFILFLLFYFF